MPRLWRSEFTSDTADGKLTKARFVSVYGQSDLPHAIGAIDFPRRFTSRLHRRHHQRNERPNDRDANKQFDDRKGFGQAARAHEAFMAMRSNRDETKRSRPCVYKEQVGWDRRLMQGECCSNTPTRAGTKGLRTRRSQDNDRPKPGGHQNRLSQGRSSDLLLSQRLNLLVHIDREQWFFLEPTLTTMEFFPANQPHCQQLTAAGPSRILTGVPCYEPNEIQAHHLGTVSLADHA